MASFEEAMGEGSERKPTSKGVSFAEARGTPESRGAGYYLGQAAKAVPAALDMILGAPAGLANNLIGAGRSAVDQALGVSRVGAEMGARESQRFLEPFQSPVESFLEGATSVLPEGYRYRRFDQSGVQHLMQAGTNALSEATGGAVSPYDAEQMVGFGMNLLGVKGLKPTVQALARPVLGPEVLTPREQVAAGRAAMKSKRKGTPSDEYTSARATYDYAEPPPAARAAEEAPAGTTTPMGFERPMPTDAAYERPVNMQDPTRPPGPAPEAPDRSMPVGQRVRTPEMIAREREIRAAFRDDPGTADYLRQLAEERSEAPSHRLITEANEVGRPPEVANWDELVGQVRGAMEKAPEERTPAELEAIDTYNRHTRMNRAFVAEREAKALVEEAEASGRTVGAPDWPELSSRARTILAEKPAFLQTAEDRAVLRDYSRRLLAAKHQIGEADPRFIRAIGAGLVGAAATAPIWAAVAKYLAPDEYEDFKAWMKRKFGPEETPPAPRPGEQLPEKWRYDQMPMPGRPEFKRERLLTDAGLGLGALALGTKGKSLFAVRRGSVEPGGAYFSTKGSSTYFDPSAAGVDHYNLDAAHIADTSHPATAVALLEETLKDPTLKAADKVRLEEALKEARAGEPFIDYTLADETPMKEAGKRLGYDGFKVWENDDIASPSSVFLWNTDKAQKLAQKAAQEAAETPSSQEGKIDRRLAVGLGAAAVGAAAGPFIAQQLGGDPNKWWTQAMLGAGGLWGATHALTGKSATTLNDALGNMSTQLGLIHPAIRRAARDFEKNVKVNTQQAYDRIGSFLTELHKNGTPALNSALLSGDSGKIGEAIKGNPTLVAGWHSVQGLLKEFETTLSGLGRFREGLTNYFPRIVKDYEGLMEALGGDARKGIERELAAADSKAMTDRGHPLTDVERSLIIDRYLAKGNSTDMVNRPDFTRRRTVDMRPELEQFYEKPADALMRYVSAAVQDVETAKFFGKDLVTRNIQGKKFTDIGNSIEKLLSTRLEEGQLTPAQLPEVRRLLRARFGEGEKSPAKWLQDVRDANNLTLLGDIASSVVQSGDVLTSFYHHGFTPTMQAVKQTLTGDGQIHPRDLGLANHVIEELGSGRPVGKVLQGVFKYGGFQAIDQFGKATHLNASMLKNQRLARTSEGRAQLTERYGRAYGDDMPQLLEDLRNGKRTDLTDSLIFSELSDAQPISKLEMPTAYLKHPNGRLLYQMKSYALKQLDVLRRDIYEELRNGSKQKALRNAAALGAVMSLSNIPGSAVKAWLSGQDFDFEKIDYLDNFLQNIGLSRYSADKALSGKPIDAVTRMVLPPVTQYQQMMESPEKAVKYAPFVGREVYNRYLGGNEEKARRERLEERRKNETPEERARRYERAAARKQLQREAAQ